MLHYRFYLPVFIFILLITTNTSAQTSKLFWVHEKTSTGKIQSADMDGSNLQDVIPNLNMAHGLAVDDLSSPQKVYFSERGESRILRANLDGTNVEEVISGVSGIRDLELDLESRKIYWVRDTWDDDAVERADMDGLNSNIEELYHSTSTIYNFLGIGLDCMNKHVYWTQRNNGCSDKIRRMKFDLSGFENVVVYPQNSLIGPWDIDVVGDKIYWTDCGLSEDVIYCANLDGSAIDTVIKEVDCQFFTIDTATSKIYWTDRYKIGCARLDGSEREELVTGLGAFLKGIAIAYNVPTAIEADKSLPKEFVLFDNYPNPFNPTTVISYQLPAVNQVELSIYNLLGQKVATLVSEKQPPGIYKVHWDATGYSSGVYFCHFKSGPFFTQQKLILLR